MLVFLQARQLYIPFLAATVHQKHKFVENLLVFLGFFQFFKLFPEKRGIIGFFCVY